jgi:hypothetical protein
VVNRRAIVTGRGVGVCPVDPRLAPDELSISAVLRSAPLPQMRLSFADGLFWSSVACCAVAQYLILRSVGGRRHLPEPSARLPRQRGAVELLWALVPAVALAALFVVTWRTMHRPAESPAERVLRSGQ